MIRRIAATLCVAGALALPGAALAMPLDNGRPAPPRPPETVTIVRAPHSDETLPIALASAALLVAMATAAFSAVRLAPPKRAES